MSIPSTGLTGPLLGVLAGLASWSPFRRALRRLAAHTAAVTGGDI